jgi:hypothetical protein
VSGWRARWGSPEVAWAAGPARDGVGELLRGTQGGHPPDPGVPVSWAAMHDQKRRESVSGIQGKGRGRSGGGDWSREQRNARGGSSMAAGGAADTAVRGRHCEIDKASKEGACGAGTCLFTHAHAETASWADPCAQAARRSRRRACGLAAVRHARGRGTQSYAGRGPRIARSIATLPMHPYAGRPYSRHVLWHGQSARAGDM